MRVWVSKLVSKTLYARFQVALITVGAICRLQLLEHNLNFFAIRR